MILSDKTIREEVVKKRIKIEPLEDECIQASSVDLHLSNEFLVFNHAQHFLVDVKQGIGELTDKVIIGEDKKFIVHPNEFVLGSTVESVAIPIDLAGRLEGKSSLGRIGIIVHATAGVVNPGWEGKLTLEIHNIGKIPVALYPGMKIAQISFHQMTTPAEKPYKGSYQHARGPEESKDQKDLFKK